MPQFFRKDTPGYWERYPAQIKDMAKVMEMSGLTPSSMFVMGEESDESAPAALIFTMAPGATIDRHSHKCERFEIILEGSLLVDDMVLGPGDVMLARPGEAYGPHTAGPDGCRTLEIFGTLAGAHHLYYEVPEGPPLSVEFGSLEALEASQQGAGR